MRYDRDRYWDLDTKWVFIGDAKGKVNLVNFKVKVGQFLLKSAWTTIVVCLYGEDHDRG